MQGMDEKFRRDFEKEPNRMGMKSSMNIRQKKLEIISCISTDHSEIKL
jgi:hypothetical protein